MSTTTEIPDLWSGISVDVVSPMSIMQTQSQYLSKHTKGLIRLDVITDKQSQRTIYNLYLVCPVLDNERHKIATVYSNETYYPVWVAGRSDGARDQDEFIAFLKQLFTSRDVKSIIDSLFAKINETKPSLTKS